MSDSPNHPRHPSSPTDHLDPLIGSRLADFQRRRRRLLLIRGALSLFAALLLTMLVVALVDWLFLLPDSVRVGLSLIAYAATFAVAWKTCLSSLLKAPDPKELAGLIERAEPGLREQLLAAVELGDFQEGRVQDSEEFRQALQKRVARQMLTADVKHMLPVGLLKRWIGAAAAVAAVLLILVMIPGLRLAPLLGRALLPAANLDRVSRTQVEFLLPAPPDQTVPGGDSVTVEVELSGSVPDRARVETFGEDDRSERVEMQRTAEGTFRAELQPGSRPLQYRVLAGDAVTRKYLLAVAERPRVVTFTKTYRPPAYSLLPHSVITETDGNIRGLESGVVDLVLSTDQSISEARIEMLGGAALDISSNASIPVEVRGDNTLAATLPLTRSGTYKVRLIAEATGFENRFSPEYLIDVQADLVPSVRIDLPQSDQTMPPGGVVHLLGEASDDVGLLSVTQETRTKSGDWTTARTLAERPASPCAVDLKWDLQSLELRTGDEIFTRLTATDLKNSKSHSNIVRILITSSATNPKDAETLRDRENLQALLTDVAQAANSARGKANELRQASNEAPLVERERLLSAARGAMEQLEEAQQRAEDAAKDLLPRIDDTMQSEDMVLVAKAATKTRNAFLTEARRALDQLTPPPATPDAQTQKETDQHEAALDAALRSAEDNSRKIEDTHASMLKADQAEAASAALAQAERGLLEARPLRDAAKTDETFAERATGATKAIAAELAQTARDLDPLATSLEGGDKKTVTDLATQISEQAKEAMQLLESRPEAGAAETSAHRLAEALDSARKRMDPLHRELDRKARDAARDLENQTGGATEAVAALQKELQQAAKLPDPSAVSAAAEQALEKAASQVGDIADIQELSPNSDAQEVRDLSTAERALQRLADSASADVNPVDNIEKALRTVEAAAEARALEDQLRDAAAKPSPGEMKEPSAQAADWNRTREELDAAPDKLQNAGLPQEQANALRDAARGDDANAVRQEMEQRNDPRRPPQSVATPLSKLAEAASAASAAMEPLAQQASEALEEMAPSIQDMAAAAAEETGKLALDSLASATGEDNAPPAPELAERQAAASEEVAGIEEALRREANAQELESAEGRAAARDADDALAMLAGKATAADQAMQEAAAAPDKPSAAAPLQAAAQEQAQLSDALRQIASHFGSENPTASREELRKAEETLGIREAMDEQYGQLENIAEMLPMTPEQQLAALEAELAQNPAMQSALGEIAADAAQAGRESLQKAAAAEKTTAADFTAATAQQPTAPEPAAQAAANAQPAIASQAAQAGAELASAARHEERLGSQETAASLKQAAAQAAQAAAGAVPAAAEALKGSPQSAPASQALQAATDALQIPIASMGPPPASPSAGGPTNPEASALAQALDQLDAAVNASPSSPASAGPPATASAPPAGGPPAGTPPAGSPPEAPAGAAPAGAPAPGTVPGAAPALASAMQAQAAAMQATRMQQAAATAAAAGPAMAGPPPSQPPSQPGPPSSQPGPGSQEPGQADGPAVTADSGNLPVPAATSSKAWGSLPTRVAEDLSQGTRETVSEEYRAQVDAYFRAVSQKAAAK